MRDAFDGGREVGAVVEVEAAQEKLVGLARAAVLGHDGAGDGLEHLAHAQERPQADLVLPDDPLGRRRRDADQVGGAALDHDLVQPGVAGREHQRDARDAAALNGDRLAEPVVADGAGAERVGARREVRDLELAVGPGDGGAVGAEAVGAQRHVDAGQRRAGAGLGDGARQPAGGLGEGAGDQRREKTEPREAAEQEGHRIGVGREGVRGARRTRRATPRATRGDRAGVVRPGSRRDPPAALANARQPRAMGGGVSTERPTRTASPPGRRRAPRRWRAASGRGRPPGVGACRAARPGRRRAAAAGRGCGPRRRAGVRPERQPLAAALGGPSQGARRGLWRRGAFGLHRVALRECEPKRACELPRACGPSHLGRPRFQPAASLAPPGAASPPPAEAVPQRESVPDAAPTASPDPPPCLPTRRRSPPARSRRAPPATRRGLTDGRKLDGPSGRASAR